MIDRSVTFERTALGPNAANRQQREQRPFPRRLGVSRIGRRIMRDANTLDAPLHQRRILMAIGEGFERKARSARADRWEPVYALLGLVASCLDVGGERPFTPTY